MFDKITLLRTLHLFHCQTKFFALYNLTYISFYGKVLMCILLINAFPYKEMYRNAAGHDLQIILP